jgi:hypothetical protein
MYGAKKLPKLPIGIQTFDEIIKDGYLYVDKTGYLVDLIDRGKVYFLSRPRRFGKSLTISTFEAIFSGRKELFRDLRAEEFLNRPDYRTYPVLRLDMSRVSTSGGARTVPDSAARITRESAAIHGIEIDESLSPADALRIFIGRLCAKAGPVAVLVDEYDKPVLDFIDRPDEAEYVRTVMRDFYAQIKSQDESVRFVFITGITKFSKMGVFSALNNLEDISMDAPYAAMLGYTESEMRGSFVDYIGRAARTTGRSAEDLVSEMRDYYDGFSFDGKSRLYNPFSTLLFFSKMEFRNYWFDSGTPSYIAKYMRDRNLTADQFRGMGVSRDFAASPGEIETATAASFLYQSGYLSLRPGEYDDFSLDYPNREVLISMSRLLTENILGSQDAAMISSSSFKRALSLGDVGRFVEEIDRLLSSIPYDDFSQSAEMTVRRRGLGMGGREWLYRSTILSFMIGMGLDVEAEPHTSGGRADLRVRFRDRVWIIEIKVAKRGEDAGVRADEAMSQILEKGYADRYDNAVLVGMAIDDERRGVAEYRTNRANG